MHIRTHTHIHVLINTSHMLPFMRARIKTCIHTYKHKEPCMRTTITHSIGIPYLINAVYAYTRIRTHESAHTSSSRMHMRTHEARVCSSRRRWGCAQGSFLYHTTYDARHTTYDIRHTAYDKRQTTYHTRHTTYRLVSTSFSRYFYSMLL